MSLANCKLQSGRHPMDIDDSGMSIYSASSVASSAKQSFPDECCGVLHNFRVIRPFLHFGPALRTFL